jgi:hypothetical protein
VQLSHSTKRAFLIPVTGLVVAYVRHAINNKQWDSVEQALVSWIIHSIALMVFFLATSAVILWSHEFFLGRKYKGNLEEEPQFYILMTVLVAAVSIYLISHAPGGYNDD